MEVGSAIMERTLAGERAPGNAPARRAPLAARPGRRHTRPPQRVARPPPHVTTVHTTIPSPVGPLLVVADAAGLRAVYFEPHEHAAAVAPARIAPASAPASDRAGPASDVVAEARAQLDAYFAGTRTTFDLPLAARGTPFQTRVWAALRAIPFGETISYAELARRVGSPSAVRAVGGANGRNPLSIVVPCHRVVGADGSLAGFGGGVERKRWLLRHEGARAASATLPLL
ncbi:hypothetical protein tb265_13370 [Gemmatimonadetes bacterium T265]|nr:hypothetical protein tb265_13370 [Gemmatimonadetes bacterium T265]